MIKVSVVKADNYETAIIDKAVNEAIKLIGDWETFIKKK